MEYNFVALNSDWDLYRQSYADVIGREDFFYVAGYKDAIPKWLHPLYLPHCSQSSRMSKKMPFRLLWNPLYFRHKFPNNNPIVFIHSGDWLDYYNYGLVSYLRGKYPNSKHVLHMTDLMWKRNYHKLPTENLKRELHNTYDLILSFDQGDCETYDALYHPLVFSDFHGKIDDRYPDSDVFFLGWAKQRLNDIIGCCERCWDVGLKTDIHILGVNIEQRVYKDKINYLEEYMSYEENLQRVLHTKCEIEMMQAAGLGFTQRMCEVVTLGKRIITNNTMIQEAPFYNPDYICQISKPSDITDDFLNKIKSNDSVDYHYKENLSPLELFEFIKKHL